MVSYTDSPLSITGNIIGILTLAYAIVITLLYYCYQLSKSTSDLRCYIDSVNDEFKSLGSAVDRLIPYIDRLPEHLAGRVRSAVVDVKILKGNSIATWHSLCMKIHHHSHNSCVGVYSSR